MFWMLRFAPFACVATAFLTAPTHSTVGYYKESSSLKVFDLSLAESVASAAALPAAGAQVELEGQHYDRYRDRFRGTHTHTSGVRPISGISL